MRLTCKRGMLEWDTATIDQAAAREHSDAMRWRREAEAALQK